MNVCKRGHLLGKNQREETCKGCQKLAANKLNPKPCKRGHTGGRYKDGHCKECFNTKQLIPSWKANNAAVRLGISKKTITLPTGVCDCCGKHVPLPQLHCDHDHVTKKFRGWCCRGCNTGVDIIDDPTMLRRRADYLEGKK